MYSNRRCLQFGKKLDMKGRYSAAHAAYVLREFLTELPEPVIPLSQYADVSAILGLFSSMLVFTWLLSIDSPDNQASKEESLDRVENALRVMPPSSRELLFYICDLIVIFAKHAPQTSWRPSGPETPTNMMSVRGEIESYGFGGPDN
jgi:hypothetical protein